MSEKTEGFPRHYPVRRTWGFAVMSGIDVQARARTGQLCLPDKEFRYLRHHCYLRLFRDSGPIISVGLLMSP
jgi:hypothetical protein